MTSQVYDPRARRSVVYRGASVPGLFERMTSDGRTVYEVRRKVGGRSVRRALEAATATDAIREARRLVARIDQGERLVGDSDASLAELRDQFEEWGRNSGADRIAASTLVLYLSRLDLYVLPALWLEHEGSGRHPRAYSGDDRAVRHTEGGRQAGRPQTRAQGRRLDPCAAASPRRRRYSGSPFTVASSTETRAGTSSAATGRPASGRASPATSTPAR